MTSPRGSTTEVRIVGATATEIADSVRQHVERGVLSPGAPLPPVRALADELGVNRNTVVAAYRLLTQAGLLEARGRAGTRVAERTPVAQEGFARGTVLRDLAAGNPDPALIPDLRPALGRIAGRPVLYGEPVIDRDLAAWAEAWMRDAVGDDRALRLTITGGASDAIERLLAQTLTRDDAVALEDPCFLASLNTVRLGGYRPVAVPVDDEGMTVDGLRAALDAGVRAVLLTPRAQNPTGASLTAERAAALRALLADHPYVLVIEDDHFSLLSSRPFHSVIAPGHHRWALIRSVSKFLGPDMCLAVVASDPDTADRLAERLNPGATWVSHLLQRLALEQLTDAEAVAAVAAASAHYAARNAAAAAALTAHGVPVSAGDGLSLWVPLPVPARAASEQLMRRGWLARPGDEFVLENAHAARHLRLTVHDLSDADLARLATDLAAAIPAAAATSKAG
ncbi:aminotransferase class I/II-fold pyridoxal phosphate-dependent enzyme [Microbacterium hominis]|uniref:aminotransferase class I/II-fold pyridoxal phosphate-dependent enzyme n=1 Tax=Microbacterium TaxID=33882 RepID=UPI00168A43E6|nr:MULTISPECIES: aminotransferase class I/II-fold pyridoxal phosphate-dependent enzyme [Microbacterium]QOC25570.1 aminotransferase class I/II-fold pyridoxal phosphate-dependent enzyme [Microbacterium hominis]QOC29572.1 aminotransferase class I/II-fold pyridoxal phosphate-dependent enzyme [Microbacterium hominis]QYF98056.1 aminotransferase class I/II-fold pyridoxal phosphate-dependent enzyme [Microbacterium sp. PAMC21962]